MAIYGTALLSMCFLIGIGLGRCLGMLCGVEADIGGVGIGMLLLIGSTDYLHRTGRLAPPTEAGIAFWSSMYVPIVVAMSASQNVVAALKASWVAITAGSFGVAICFGLVAVFTRLDRASSQAGA